MSEARERREEIESLIAVLKDKALEYPELRLCQLISNALIRHEETRRHGNDHYYVWDRDLLCALRALNLSRADRASDPYPPSEEVGDVVSSGAGGDSVEPDDSDS